MGVGEEVGEPSTARAVDRLEVVITARTNKAVNLENAENRERDEMGLRLRRFIDRSLLSLMVENYCFNRL